MATHDAVKTLLALQGRILPSMTLLVPQDSIGPMMLGDNARGDDLKSLPGYNAVKLFGTPQPVFGKDPKTGRYENGHADDSIQEALRLAKTNQFSAIYFNRGYTMVTDGLVQSQRRPDVFAVALPRFSNPHRYQPYESFSKGQNARTRQPELPDVPDIAPVYVTKPEHWKKNPDK